MATIKKITSILTGTLIVASSILATNSARADTTTILNFDTQFDGTPITTGDGTKVNETQLFQGYGVELGTNNPNNRPLVLFNSNCGPDFGTQCTGGDPDLASGPSFGSEAQGNVLIIQERNNLTIPDDDADGGIFEFDFTDKSGVTFDKVGVLDLDEGVNPIFKFFQEKDGVETTTVFNVGDVGLGVTLLNPSNPGDNSLREYDFSALTLSNVKRLEVELDDVSGAIAYLQYQRSQEVPEPTTILSLIAVGGLGLLTKKKSMINKA
ncbi:MAG: PEP-CTERM sorting domain-containing protein [Spirulinaceae cyanobacterium]